MLEKLMDIFGLAVRQRLSIYRVGDFFNAVFQGNFEWKKAVALFIAVTDMFGCVLFDMPMTPLGHTLDLTGYTQVFCDEFDGDTLNTDVWEFRHLGKDSGGFNDVRQVTVSDGKLHFKAEYKENGPYGAGWYAADLQLKKMYKRGYFEIKCKCNDGGGFWSAFWIQAQHPYDHELSAGGVGGAEIDIMEAMLATDKNLKRRYSVTNTVHCNGVDDDAENIDSYGLGKFYVGNNIYENYNTYGLEWTEDEYIFYVNGVETGRTAFGKGVSQVEEYVCVSLCIPGEVKLPRDFTSEYTVDYVKIYQK